MADSDSFDFTKFFQPSSWGWSPFGGSSAASPGGSTADVAAGQPGQRWNQADFNRRNMMANLGLQMLNRQIQPAQIQMAQPVGPVTLPQQTNSVNPTTAGAFGPNRYGF